MIKQMAPLYYYPMTVCFLDDNELFLKNNLLGLDPTYRYQYFCDPVAVLHLLEHQNDHADIAQSTEVLDLLELDDDIVDKKALSLNLSVLSDKRNDSKRHDNCNVLVIDYAMPYMNGLDVCRALQNSPVKKILITGQADHRLAVEAFNENIIDHFILKNDPCFYKQLNKTISKLHWCYFEEITENLFNNLSQFNCFCLKSPKVIAYFKAFCHNYSIQEAYLIDASGSFLGINATKKNKYFVVKNAIDVQESITLAEQLGASSVVINSLKKEQKILFFLTESDYLMPVAHWDEHLVDCQYQVQDQGMTYYIGVLNCP